MVDNQWKFTEWTNDAYINMYKEGVHMKKKSEQIPKGMLTSGDRYVVPFIVSWIIPLSQVGRAQPCSKGSIHMDQWAHFSQSK